MWRMYEKSIKFTGCREQKKLILYVLPTYISASGEIIISNKALTC
jgi:hypothetical protein